MGGIFGGACVTLGAIPTILVYCSYGISTMITCKVILIFYILSNQKEFAVLDSSGSSGSSGLSGAAIGATVGGVVVIVVIIIVVLLVLIYMRQSLQKKSNPDNTLSDSKCS